MKDYLRPNNISQFKFSTKPVAFLFAALILMLLPYAESTAQSQPIGFQVQYKVYYGDLNIGTSTRKVVGGADGLSYSEHRVKSGKLLEMLGEKSYVQRTTIQVSQSGVKPVEFNVTNWSDVEIARVDFDWDNRKIQFSGGNSAGMPDHQVLDWESWFVSLAVSDLDALEGKYVTIAEQSKTRTYQYGAPSSAELKLKGERVDTIKIRMQNTGDHRRSYDVWISPELHNVPIRIDKNKKSQKINFIITSFDWVYPE